MVIRRLAVTLVSALSRLGLPCAFVERHIVYELLAVPDLQPLVSVLRG